MEKLPQQEESVHNFNGTLYKYGPNKIKYKTPDYVAYSTDSEVIIHVFTNSDKIGIEKIKNLCSLQATTPIKNVVKLIGYNIYPDKKVVFTQNYECNLTQLISRGGIKSNKSAINLFQQICHGAEQFIFHHYKIPFVSTDNIIVSKENDQYLLSIFNYSNDNTLSDKEWDAQCVESLGRVLCQMVFNGQIPTKFDNIQNIKTKFDDANIVLSKLLYMCLPSGGKSPCKSQDLLKEFKPIKTVKMAKSKYDCYLHGNNFGRGRTIGSQTSQQNNKAPCRSNTPNTKKRKATTERLIFTDTRTNPINRYNRTKWLSEKVCIPSKVTQEPVKKKAAYSNCSYACFQLRSINICHPIWKQKCNAISYNQKLLSLDIGAHIKAFSIISKLGNKIETTEKISSELPISECIILNECFLVRGNTGHDWTAFNCTLSKSSLAIKHENTEAQRMISVNDVVSVQACEGLDCAPIFLIYLQFNKAIYFLCDLKQKMNQWVNALTLLLSHK